MCPCKPLTFPARIATIACYASLLLQGGCSIHMMKVSTSSPFLSAAQTGDAETIKDLLNQGADINLKGPSDLTALQRAANWGHLDTVRTLLDRGANVNARAFHIVYTDGSVQAWTPLHYAILMDHQDIVPVLLAEGAELEMNNTNGMTPLEMAERKGQTEIASLLKQAEADRLLAAQQPAGKFLESDVDLVPSVNMPPRKQSYAVVVGIETYREKLPKADFAVRDAELISRYLTSVLGYPEENVILRTNENASLTDLIKYFEDWLPNNVERDGSVFVYYSGHGAPNLTTGDAFLVPFDGDPTFVESTGYPLDRLYAALEKLPAKEIMVVVDSCFSGAGGRSVIARGARPLGIPMENPLPPSRKTVVLSASAGNQISNTFEEQGHGLLTYFFLKGLQGEGDTNQDGKIQLGELFEYIRPNVQKIARRGYNNEQTPQLQAPPEIRRNLTLRKTS